MYTKIFFPYDCLHMKSGVLIGYRHPKKSCFYIVSVTSIQECKSTVTKLNSLPSNLKIAEILGIWINHSNPPNVSSCESMLISCESWVVLNIYKQCISAAFLQRKHEINSVNMQKAVLCLFNRCHILSGRNLIPLMKNHVHLNFSQNQAIFNRILFCNNQLKFGDDSLADVADAKIMMHLYTYVTNCNDVVTKRLPNTLKSDKHFTYCFMYEIWMRIILMFAAFGNFLFKHLALLDKPILSSAVQLSSVGTHFLLKVKLLLKFRENNYPKQYKYELLAAFIFDFVIGFLFCMWFYSYSQALFHIAETLMPSVNGIAKQSSTVCWENFSRNCQLVDRKLLNWCLVNHNVLNWFLVISNFGQVGYPRSKAYLLWSTFILGGMIWWDTFDGASFICITIWQRKYFTKVTFWPLDELIRWLMGIPIGLKLNSPLNHFLGKFFLHHVRLWLDYIQILLLTITSDNAAWVMVLFYISCFGFSFVIAIASDFLSLLTFHVYCFYIYAARLYGLQVAGLLSFWRLFRGKKWNPLRLRVDTLSHSPNVASHRFFTGTLIFTILLFLLPTTALYYAIFAVFRLVVLSLQKLLHSFHVWVACFPWLSLVRRLVKPHSFANFARFDRTDFLLADIGDCYEYFDSKPLTHFKLPIDNLVVLDLVLEVRSIRAVIYSGFKKIVGDSSSFKPFDLRELSSNLISGKMLKQI